MLVFDVEIQCDEYQRRCMACEAPATDMTPFGLGEVCNWCLDEVWPQEDNDPSFPRDIGGEG